MKLQIALALLLASANACAADDSAADEMASMAAVSAVWDRYAEASSRNNDAATRQISESAYGHYAFLRDAALVASADQVRRIPISDRVIVYVLRASRSEAELRAMDGNGIARMCFAEGWCGVAEPDEGQSLPALTHVTLVAPDRAIGELGAPTGTQFQFGPEFRYEQNAWRVLPQATAWSDSLAIQQTIRQSGMSEDEMIEYLVADSLGDSREAPVLAVLDRPLVDDAVQRTRLNEIWPDYQANFRTRVQAMEVKADRGDPLAQFGLGAMYYYGKPEGLVAQDTAKGIQWLEAASDNGHSMAAAAAIEVLIEQNRPAKGKAPEREVVARLGRHAKRAAEGGVPMAMVMWGNFLFNGAAGMARDCQQAEEWAARGEDAGVAHARNERVWYLATCPIPDQRDPAKAIALASHLMAKPDKLTASELDTVAAALAANARFEEAQDYQSRAIAKLEPDATATRKRMKERLDLYRSRRDWVQTYDATVLPR